MRPYTSRLTAASHGFGQTSLAALHSTSVTTRCDIALWHAFLVLLHLEVVSIHWHPSALRRPLCGSSTTPRSLASQLE